MKEETCLQRRGRIDRVAALVSHRLGRLTARRSCVGASRAVPVRRLEHGALGRDCAARMETTGASSMGDPLTSYVFAATRPRVLMT